MKSNQPIVKSPTPTHPSLRTSRRVASDQSLFPSGWAPGPAGEGHPLKLDITLPKENSAPEALKHYARIRDQLRQRVHAGGRDAVVVIVNVRLNTHVPGRAKSTIILVSVHSVILQYRADYCTHSRASPLPMSLCESATETSNGSCSMRS